MSEEPQKVSFDACCGWAVFGAFPVGIDNVIAQRSKQKRQRGDTLLAVDQQPASKTGGSVSGRNINYRAHEVTTSGGIACDDEEILPELFALWLRPAVVALEYRDHELRGAIDDFGKWPVDRFHGVFFSV